MTISLATPVMSAGIGKPASVVAYAQRNGAMRLGEVKRYIDAIYDLAPKVGLNPDILVAQSDEETAHWTSDWWVDRLNPAGIGITGDPAQNAASGEWADGADAAKAQIVHMLAYTRGAIPTIAEPWLKFDPRYQAVFQEKFNNTVALLDDLGGGTWAADPHYAENIVKHYHAIFGEDVSMAETIVFGRVPKPPIEIMICKKAGDGHGYFEVAPRKPIGSCRHCTAGRGSIEWYHDFFSIGGERADDALVDFIISRDGRIAMFNDPFGTRSPWANGPGQPGAEGDGLKLINTLGIGIVNSGIFSVEHEGYDTDEMTPEQLEASIWLWAWMYDGASGHPNAIKLRTPYSSYPINPNVGLNTDIEHWELSDKTCPAAMRANTDAHQAGVRALLKKHQVTVTPAPEPKPEPVPSIYPPGMTVQLARRLYGTLKVSWAEKPFAFDPERSECRWWLNRGKAQLKPGEHYSKAKWPKISDVVRRGDGTRAYVYSDGSTYDKAAREV